MEEANPDMERTCRSQTLDLLVVRHEYKQHSHLLNITKY